MFRFDYTCRHCKWKLSLKDTDQLRIFKKSVDEVLKHKILHEACLEMDRLALMTKNAEIYEETEQEKKWKN